MPVQYRENIVSLLYIPSVVVTAHPNSKPTPSHLFLAVNKFGKVGLYHPGTFSLIHTYCLDLSLPVFTTSSTTYNNITPVVSKCERTHLVTDAVFSEDTLCVIFSTTKCLLQWYDIGEIQTLDIGLKLFPRKECLSLSGFHSGGNTPIIHNNGHVECHRLMGLDFIPTLMEYHARKLIIGDVDGGVTIIGIPTPNYPLGLRKIRGKLHKLHVSELPPGTIQHYKAHYCPITDLQLIPERNLILTSSKDKKFSVYVKDISGTPMESIIVSLNKGVNSLSYSHELKMVATGSDDYVVRLFNQFIMKMPQMEMMGHRSSIIAVRFVQVGWCVTGSEHGDKPTLLLSYSADSVVNRNIVQLIPNKSMLHPEINFFTILNFVFRKSVPGTHLLLFVYNLFISLSLLDPQSFAKLLNLPPNLLLFTSYKNYLNLQQKLKLTRVLL